MNVRSRNFRASFGNERQSSGIVIPSQDRRTPMRKFVLALAAVAAFGLAAPTVTATPANAETVIIKKRGHDHGGWRRAHNRSDKVVIIKKRGHGHHHHRGHGRGHRHHMH
jgi:hypothetical protein